MTGVSGVEEVDDLVALSASLGGAAVLLKGRNDCAALHLNPTPTAMATADRSGASTAANAADANAAADAGDVRGLALVLGASVEAGSPRRCGGQGDITSGAAAVFLHWALALHQQQPPPHDDEGGRASGVTSGGMGSGDYEGGGAVLWAAWAAAMLTKRCAAAAFAKHKRSTTAPDMLAEVGAAADAMFPLDG